MSRNLRVYKQSELASRDTTAPHFLYEINSAGFRPWDGGEKGGVGGGLIQTLIKRGGRSPKKNLFSALRASVCVKIREGEGEGVGSPSPSPESATDKYLWAITSSTNEFHFKQTG